MHITAFRHDTEYRRVADKRLDGRTDRQRHSQRYEYTHALCGENGVIAAKQNNKLL